MNLKIGIFLFLNTHVYNFLQGGCFSTPFDLKAVKKGGLAVDDLPGGGG